MKLSTIFHPNSPWKLPLCLIIPSLENKKKYLIYTCLYIYIYFLDYHKPFIARLQIFAQIKEILLCCWFCYFFLSLHFLLEFLLFTLYLLGPSFIFFRYSFIILYSMILYISSASKWILFIFRVPDKFLHLTYCFWF